MICNFIFKIFDVNFFNLNFKFCRKKKVKKKIFHFDVAKIMHMLIYNWLGDSTQFVKLKSYEYYTITHVLMNFKITMT